MNKASATPSRRPTALLGTLIAAVSLLSLVGPASALGAPALDVASSHLPITNPVPAGTHARYTLTVSNAGDTDTSGPIDLTFTVPVGARVVSVSDPLGERLTDLFGSPVAVWDCAIAGDQLSVSCEGFDTANATGLGPFPIPSGGEACVDLGQGACKLGVVLKSDEDATPGTLVPNIEACSASATPNCATALEDPIEIVPFAFELTEFDGSFLKEGGNPENDAGGRPYSAANLFHINTAISVPGAEFLSEEYPVGEVKDATVELPVGLIGNPRAYPTCTPQQLQGGVANCPAESQVGLVTLFGPGKIAATPLAVYNMEVPFGLPALFAFNIAGALGMVYGEVRTGEDYGINLTTKNIPQTVQIGGTDFAFWGVPADPSHDSERYCAGRPIFALGCTVTPTPQLRPFVSLPTSCTGEAAEFRIEAISWEGDSARSSFLTHDNLGTPIPIADGCNGLGSGFDPTLEARPTTTVADAPSGLDVDLRIPQNSANCNPGPPVSCGLATAHLRDATVTLPEGLVINPSSANGLDGCSPVELGLLSPVGVTPIKTTPTVDRCPQASRIGSVVVETPLLEDPLPGSVYVADPFDNPFRSLIALYVVVDDKRTGIVVKLAGEVTPNLSTGRLTASFEENPQLPFENFRLRFFGGAGASLRTPAICGTHTTTSSLTPWSAPDSGPPAEPTDTWQIEQNCSATAAQQPHAPSFDAGAASPIAGAHSPFVVKLRREDGSQNFSAVTMTPPQGLIAKLVGTEPCSDTALSAAESKTGAGEKANPSCPASSQVGTVTAGAGAGPAPYYAQGKVYLSGPYKGAPLSFAIVTPATAGPFDLGTIVVKTAIHLNSKTAEITAISDQIPTILEGIPLDVRSVDLALDRPNFTLNGTSCDPSAVTGSLLSTTGANANLNARFQLAECTNLGFKPKMTLRLKGGTKRGKHPQLTATLLPRAGDANIASVSVAFPKSEFLENAHIRTICTRPDFAADNCPAGAIYGTAAIMTPLLDYELPGNVYLRSSDNLLPDLVTDLRGPAHQPIRLETAGRTDSVNQGIRNTFDFIPDAPFTKAVVALQGGNRGLLVNSRDICAKVYRATVRFTAHNGMTHVAKPKMQAQCKKKRGKKGKAKKRAK